MTHQTNGRKGKGGSILGWVTALGTVGAALAAITGPLSDLSEARLRNAEMELKRTEIELEKIKARQQYVLKTFGDFDTEEQLALLQFLESEYPDAATGRWVRLQAIRLKAIISKESIEEATKLRKTQADIKKEVSDRRPTPKDSESGVKIENALRPEEVQKINSQISSYMNAKRQFSEADALTGERIMRDEPPLACDETNLNAVVFKPFSNDRLLQSYEGEEKAGIIKACFEVRPPSSTEWPAQYLGPKDIIAKIITCQCPTESE